MKKIKSYQLTIVAFILGAALGLILQQEVTIFRLIGDVFVRLIKFAVVPLVLIAIVNSILNIHGTKGAKKMVLLVLAIFVVSTAISATIGTINALIINPGGADIVVDTENFAGATTPTFNEFVLNLIPSNPFAALVEANTFHIIVIAVCIGLVIVAIGKDKFPTTIKVFEEANEIIMKYIKAIVKIAPLGIFALTSTSFANFGWDMLTNLLKYFVAIVISIVVIYLVYFGVLMIFSKGKVKTRLKALSKILIVAASTSSSAATLPVSMQVCDEIGIDKKVSKFVLPFGVTMNMNGAAQFMAVTFVFIAQVYGVQLSIGAMILAILMITVLVMATPGIPGGAMVPTTIVLAAFNIPVEYFAIVIGLYSLIDMLDTTLNVTGDVVTSIVVDKVCVQDKD